MEAQSDQQWNPMFLEEMFENLAKKKKEPSELPAIPKDTKYKGFKTIPIQELQPRKLHLDDPVDGRNIWKKDLVKTIYCYQESCHLSYKNQNGFFKAFYDAYIQHGDVKITPDDLWLTIMLFFSKYVYRNAEQLRKAFVNHEGKKELIVQTNQKDETKWQEFFEKMIVQIRQKSVKGVTEHLECNFTSTDTFSKFLSTAMVMNAYQKYFDYTRMICICGIQNLHMGGELQDWLKLTQKLQFLRQFDVDGKLKTYIDRLKPVLQQFVQTYKGNPSLWFWNNVYTERKPDEQAYGVSHYVNGWIIRFFTLEQELTPRSLNIQEIDVPIKLVNLITNTVKQLSLVGGCRGVSVEDKKVYRPHFSFAIVQKSSTPKHGRYEKF